jgi:hypothetical protein
MKTILCCLLVMITATPVATRAESNAGEAVIVEVDQNLIQGGGVFNVLTYAAPKAIELSATGLKEAGLVAGTAVPRSDEIRIFANRDVMNASPLARIWLNQREGGAYWFISGGEGAAADFIIPEGAAVVVWSRVGTAPVSWTNVFR